MYITNGSLFINEELEKNLERRDHAVFQGIIAA